jgi:hypothetical protein
MNKLLSFLRRGFLWPFYFNNQVVINIDIVKFKYYEIKLPDFLTSAVDIQCSLLNSLLNYIVFN